ncbi:PREDICTED: serine-threonine kinase receptor-associated protein [Dipodomys ordii]|uniref:Serine-threonine kinase receptor-associated protein n=1 Tax=Dipodomys ordii TaxID=10020 RepID=A0A1S3FXD6_DIPOR|nr:PREDICTED: serine-threonine kinase receptor-associated protein [Dipodomys ordii]
MMVNGHRAETLRSPRPAQTRYPRPTLNGHAAKTQSSRCQSALNIPHAKIRSNIHYGKPMLRQGDTGDWIGTFLGHKGAVWGATLNQDATKAATAAADFTAKVWDAVSGDELMTLAHKHIVKTVDFTQDSNYLLTGGQDKLLRIYDLNKPEAEPKEIGGHTSGIKKALWCSGDKQILSADDKTVRLWDHASMAEVKSLSFSMSVSSMAYIPEGEILVLTYGRTIAFHSALSLDPIKSFEAPATINSASLHPEKEFLVAGGEDFKLYKYDYSSGEELESYKGHFGPIHCVRFSPDGELYASGSEDGTLRLWQTVVGKTYGLWKCVLPGECPRPSAPSSSSASRVLSVTPACVHALGRRSTA